MVQKLAVQQWTTKEQQLYEAESVEAAVELPVLVKRAFPSGSDDHN